MQSPLLSHGWSLSTFQILISSCGQRFSMSHNKTLAQPLWTSKPLLLFTALFGFPLLTIKMDSSTYSILPGHLKNLLQLIFKAGLLPYPWFPQDLRYVKVSYCLNSVLVISIVLQTQRGWNSVQPFLLQINKHPFLYEVESLSFTNPTWPE